MRRFALMRKKERWTATWLGNSLKIALFIFFIFIFSRTIYPFLAPDRPLLSDILVVEGFIPDYALKESIKIFQRGNYRLMIVTGKQRTHGSQLDQYRNDGDYAAATLVKMGFDPDMLQVIALENDVRRDRTYASALAVKDWLNQNGLRLDSLDVVSIGCHSRRSRYLYRLAFDKKTEIGIHAIRNKSYDPDKWWKSSHGFRDVLEETIAYIYAVFFFFPGK
ncbi:MAG: hypothetical protein JW731_02180 [Bacteroidales bacterium]|nr:hypothetical protein [Bacteroidales bacterium]